MRPPNQLSGVIREPIFIHEANEIIHHLNTLSVDQLMKCMRISHALALKTYDLIASWSARNHYNRQAIDSFLGDIYSGLQVQQWTDSDYQYADLHLRILSGLYGILRPLDGIQPYRLEMGYKLPDSPFNSLYSYWNNKIATSLPQRETIINLAAVEYSKVVTKYISKDAIITPRFLTVNPATLLPAFVAVHAKIARGAFANWLIKNKIDDKNMVVNFNGLGYTYIPDMSSTNEPVFVCKTFRGLGLSVRLSGTGNR